MSPRACRPGHPPGARTPAIACSPLPLAISIGRPRAAASLDTDRIAVVQAGLRFDYVAAVRWSEPAPQMLQQLVVRAVAADGRFATVVAAPSRVPPELLLDVELRRFEAVYAVDDAPPTVTVELQVTLVDARRSQRLVSFVVRSDAAAAANRRDAVLGAFERATAESVLAIVAGLRESSSAIEP